MRTTLRLLVVLLIAAPSISYFKYERKLEATRSGGQHYIAVDETLWERARPDLDDLRIYSAGKEIPYTLTIERGGSEIEQKKINVLQPGTVGGNTQFLLDMSDISRYDRVDLKLRTKNFVAHARVEGGDDPHGKQWSILGTTTLYDLSDDVDTSVKPSDIEGGTAGMVLAQKAVWRDLSSAPSQAQQGRDTVLTFAIPGNVPVERVLLSFDPAQQNFRREIEIQSDNGTRSGSGEISRIHMQRNGQRIDVEQPWFDTRGTGSGTLKAVIHNGDDLPLKITAAHLEQYERRIYFDSDSGANLELYYGDEKLGAPIYDYAKLFQKDASADQSSYARKSRTPPMQAVPMIGLGRSAIQLCCGWQLSRLYLFSAASHCVR
jgi:hypothetical protein